MLECMYTCPLTLCPMSVPRCLVLPRLTERQGSSTLIFYLVVGSLTQQTPGVFVRADRQSVEHSLLHFHSFHLSPDILLSLFLSLALVSSSFSLSLSVSFHLSLFQFFISSSLSPLTHLSPCLPPSVTLSLSPALFPSLALMIAVATPSQYDSPEDGDSCQSPSRCQSV